MIAAVSGGFDPLHQGHLELFEEASTYGDLVVLLNSDDFLIRKKGYRVLDYKTRERVIESLACVAAVVPVVDEDETVCQTLRLVWPDVFVNGGDRNSVKTIPEAKVCEELKIDMVFTGQKKRDSSSAIIERIWQEKTTDSGEHS